MTRPTDAPEPQAADVSLTPADLLSDEEVMLFIVRGYHLVRPEMPAGFHEEVCARIAALETSPGNGVLDAVPLLAQVYRHPRVHGALASLLGAGYTMNGHRHLHITAPGQGSQSWHQDGTNVRHHQVWTVLGMYYPQDVSAEMGPTVILPGSHFRNAPTDRMATYANLVGQKALTVEAGTVAITHYDLWHAATRNRSDRQRYMLKFLFDRQAAPSAPSWRHDPAPAEAVVKRLVSDMVGGLGYGSDYYKEWELRKEMWQWLCGRPQHVPAGAFKDMLA